MPALGEEVNEAVGGGGGMEEGNLDKLVIIVVVLVIFHVGAFVSFFR